MYAYINGTLVEAFPTHAVLDVQGVGYCVHIPVSDFGKLPQLGEKVCLHTAFIVRELSQTLYGFLAKESRDLFQELITISGVGPKTGLGILGHLSLEELKKAVSAHDAVRFAKVPGIGKKTAERLLIELQGKLNVQALPQSSSGRLGDALQALMQLGYTQSAAEKAVQKAAGLLASDTDLSEIITTALKFR
ncbi:MAG: Holliday junction ATP-dependent DNA helicase RuvA [Chlamydiales bacterium]|nr:Holliday junction ATP-dependent DNA helicase RuvA [Chlamydiales bacterium]